MRERETGSEESYDRARERRVVIFEERYGPESILRLQRLLGDPCLTFAEVASRFGVTRERVRQWQAEWLPGTPSGRDRQRICRERHRRRSLLSDDLFRSFFHHLRPHVDRRDLVFVPARQGFRRRIAMVQGRSVALKAATARRQAEGAPPSYGLATCSQPTELVYFRLSAADYLLLPSGQLPAGGTVFKDTAGSKYQQFQNSPDALKTT